ncbi:MAG TPA: hypothetical protein VJU16_06135 [Planctomycetota bacterium]|nr:hypothetical protein [Planctomycetota bacterium]
MDTTADGYPDADLRKVEVLSADGKEIEVETCRWCSPYRVLVCSPSRENLRIRIRGEAVWSSAYTLSVKEVGKPERFQVGDFTIQYEFLKVAVTSAAPLDRRLFKEVSIGLELMNGQSSGSGYGGSFSSGCRYHPTWCMSQKPSAWGRDLEYSMATEEAHDFGKGKDLEPSDVKSVEIYFRKAFLEPFQAEAVLPAE